MRHLEIDREQVALTRQLGEGNFGTVYEASAVGIKSTRRACVVAVKFLNAACDAADQMTFLKEAIRMSEVHCPYIVQLLAVCFHTQPAFIAIEHMAQGDLKALLRHTASANHALGVDKLLAMGADLAAALQYLASIKLVHRDIAARNVLVNKDGNAKLGDFGLTRSMYQSEVLRRILNIITHRPQYYRKTGAGAIPLRWCAPESVFEGLYTLQSDVWMFAVLLWGLSPAWIGGQSCVAEMFSNGAHPYDGVTDMDVMRRVRRGETLACPPACPYAVFDLMLQCWQLEPGRRPAASHIHTLLSTVDVNEMPPSKPRAPSIDSTRDVDGVAM